MSKVTIIDYGCGNLFNLVNALEEVGISSKITDSPTEARKSDRLILPGVGAFGHGVQNLNQRNLTESVLEVAKAGRPVMGICLGMQLLATKSEELGTWDGLDLIPGEVRSLRDMGASDAKVPQIGWNYLQPSEAEVARGASGWTGSILENLPTRSAFYFVHSYGVLTRDPRHTIALTEYGGCRFASVIQRENVVGCQFHPERSGELGLQLLRAFGKG